jgi:hypothetical protein
MHFAGAKEYKEFRGKMEGANSPPHKANELLVRLKEARRQKILGPEYDELQRKREALDRDINDLQRDYDQARHAQVEVNRHSHEARREEIRQELFAAYNKAVEPYYSEYHTGVSYLRSSMARFYNTPYLHHLHAQGLVKKTYRYRDEPDDIVAAISAYQPENWKTDVRAWDWRTRWERDGTISQFPMTQQWLKRVRGDGPINIIDEGPRP